MGVRPRDGGGGLTHLRRGGGLRLLRILLLGPARSEKEGKLRRRWRGGDEEELLKDGDPQCRGGLRERAGMGLLERGRCGGPPERDERSLEGVLPRREGRGGERDRGR